MRQKSTGVPNVTIRTRGQGGMVPKRLSSAVGKKIARGEVGAAGEETASSVDR